MHGIWDVRIYMSMSMDIIVMDITVHGYDIIVMDLL